MGYHRLFAHDYFERSALGVDGDLGFQSPELAYFRFTVNPPPPAPCRTLGESF